ncbi:glycosyltransferase [Anoxybacillus kestanbolensis]|uniref:glycosyltransferase n=1 Tax=Anoxybacillus kestanbolensis TaxID=227476 RepID=UPI00208DA8CE|nr:glycosyltransferase [Anoxybacillus kestanbolensis]
MLIVPSWYPTEERPNAGIFFKEQAIALQEQGLEVIVAYPEIHSIKELKKQKFKRGFYYNIEDGLETYRIKEYNFLPKIRRGSSIIYYLKLRNIFARLIKEGKKPDIIHAHSVLWGGWAAAKISKQHNIPLIITEHSSAFVRGLIKEYQKPFIREAFDQAKKVIAVGPSLEKELEKYTEREKIILIPNIVNTSLFKPNDDIQKSNKFRFFSLAFLTYNKGFDVLLKAFAKAFKGNREVELVIGGDGEERGNLEKLAVDLEVEKQVTFLGELSREQAAMEMQKCDAFVLASRFETFGVVFIEALACGKPIIATKCGGPEMIVEEYNGILVEVDNVIELSVAMKQVLKNFERYNKNIICTYCYQKFGKENVIRQISYIYQCIVQQ